MCQDAIFPNDIGFGNTPNSISLGNAELSPSNANIEQMNERADPALLEAKHKGRNRVVIWTQQ